MNNEPLGLHLLPPVHSCVCVWFCLRCVQFAVQEEKRQKNERLQQQQKHENQMRDLQLQGDANIRELQQLQVQSKALFKLFAKHLNTSSNCESQKSCCFLGGHILTFARQMQTRMYRRVLVRWCQIFMYGTSYEIILKCNSLD